MRKFDILSASAEFSLKHCRAVAEKALKPRVFMHHEAMSTFLESKKVLSIFLDFSKICFVLPSPHIPIESPLLGMSVSFSVSVHNFIVVLILKWILN